MRLSFVSSALVVSLDAMTIFGSDSPSLSLRRPHLSYLHTRTPHRNLNFQGLKSHGKFEDAMNVSLSKNGSVTSNLSAMMQKQLANMEVWKTQVQKTHPRVLQSSGISFQEFCSLVQSPYLSAGYDCSCDSVDQYVACSAPLGEHYSSLLLFYEPTIQDYDWGVDCVCSTAACDKTPTDCIMVLINDFSCATFDIATEGSICHHCRICSKSSGLVEVEADRCYATDPGCMTTSLLAEIQYVNPGSSPTSPPVSQPAPFPTSTPVSRPVSPPTQQSIENPPTQQTNTTSTPVSQPVSPPTQQAIENSPTHQTGTNPPNSGPVAVGEDSGREENTDSGLSLQFGTSGSAMKKRGNFKIVTVASLWTATAGFIIAYS